MAGVDLKSLVDRLDDRCRSCLEAAGGLTLGCTHYHVEIEHFLLSMLDAPGNELAVALGASAIAVERVSNELTASLDRLRRGCTRPPSFSPDLVSTMQEAWLLASIEEGDTEIRFGHMLAALLQDPALSRALREASPLLASINAATLRTQRSRLADPPARPAPGGVASARNPDALARYTVDLTARALDGQLDPVVGRDAEIRQVIDILLRRRQNNPILTGEAGVGKTAIVEGLALRIAVSDVPEALRDVRIHTLDLGLLQAGASMKGEFEARLKAVIDAVGGSLQPIVLFIDEAHTLIGAGGAAGQQDAANLLKPALARGELRTIAATTWAEYKLYFEKDAALTRRFQVVKVEEPSEAAACAMIRGMVGRLEAHHGVRILDEAVTQAVRLSARFIPARQLPDKAVSLIDTACARVSVSQSAPPAAVEDLRRSIFLTDAELAILAREDQEGTSQGTRVAALDADRAAAVEALAALEARWTEELAQVQAIKALRRQMDEAQSIGAGAADTLRAELIAAQSALAATQGEQPLVFATVDGAAVSAVVQNWTGIPAGRMRESAIRAILNLRETMESRVLGQPAALQAVVQAIQTSSAKLTDPRKPIGVFLMVGTSGVGKTETALLLADLLYGGEQNLTVINMTEFKEEHKVSLLMGSPPGYVGYGEGGVLTEAVRRRPYSVILLDEMEKAHPGVQDVFFQVFDKGMMKDGSGRDVDFKNTLIIMTSNAGTELITKLCADPETAPDAAGLAQALLPELAKSFKPAFLGRVTLVPYFPLQPTVLRGIVELQLGRIARRLHDAYGASVGWAPGLSDAIALRCVNASAGARNVDHILSRSLLPDLSAVLLARLADGLPVSDVQIALSGDIRFSFTVS